ncbi:MAG: response regulator [Pseudomonas sp.]|uniref:response regulator n=1 Tax=Pseudomonas sp. TaxID=306 RepID=UPI0030F32D0E
MPTSTAINEQGFRRILSRNVALPLGMGVLSAVFFIGLVYYLLNVLQWVEHTDRVIGNTNDAYRLTIDQETGMRGYLITGDEKFLSPFEVARPRIASELQALKELVKDNPGQVDRFRRIEALQQQWAKFADAVIESRRSGNDYQGVISSGRGKELTDEIRKGFDEIIASEQQLRFQRNNEANNTVVLTIALYLLFSLAVSGILAFVGRRELLGLSNNYSNSLLEQQRSAAVIQQKAWLRNGQSLLAEQVLGQKTLSQLGQAVLSQLASYLGVSVAAFYVRDPVGGVERVATFGFAADQENTEQRFSGNDSMVGQAVQERRLIRLDNLPHAYLSVASGLGSTSQLNIVVLPISNENQVNGVLELAFLRPITDTDLEFLELVSANIGTSIDAAHYRQRLQDVLAETQQLNEELQVQQEELRTANEELEEQSRVLKESQAHLETQQAELEQTNEQLAEQAQRLEDQRDTLDEKNNALGVAQRELEERAQELQRASLYKSEFLANMSHELRTPLNSSLILAKLLGDNPDGNLTAEQVKFADSIYSAGNDLLLLINDILDISKVEAGKLDVRPQNMPVNRLVETLRTVFQPVAGEKSLGFSIDLQPSVPATLYTDQQRVEQILKNLLSNAIKFTEQGQVTLSISRQADGRVAFAVTDTGIGIRQDQQDYIFEAFRQADGTTNRRYGGTGLGLSISRDLATLLGGSIHVVSAPGKGSTFTLVLPQAYEEVVTQSASSVVAPDPVAAAIQATTPVPVASGLAAPVVAQFADDRERMDRGGRSILVIEDEPNFAQILFDLAHELKYSCLVAHGADNGLELAATHIPDAILLDMRLPDASGLTVLQRLKENPLTRHIPVHVISVEDRMEAALQLGAIGYAVKPTTREHLKGVFAKLEAKLAQRVKRVLLVEDDALQRDSIARLIGDDDIEITAVEFGGQALELLRSNVYDCMIIDLKLPDMRGNDLLKRMSDEDICSFPPVIVYTGRNLTRDEEIELMKYSRSIIIKGARSPERLLDEVTLFLHKVESQLSSERQNMLKTARNRDKVFEGRRILLVDDDVRNIFALTSALEHKGAVVEVARNGREALTKLEEVEDIDLVLMDVMMPEMDGYEATAEIRKNPRWRKLPVIAVTAKAMKDDQDRCLQAGANDYLAKPIDLDRLFSLIRVWMPKLERI